MSTVNETCNVFVTQLKADKKKAVVLALMALVMVGVYVRLLLKPKPQAEAAASPIAASAAPPTVSAAPAPEVATTAPNGVVPERIAGGALSRQFVRDLFDTDLSIFTPSEETVAKTQRSAATQPGISAQWWRRLARMLEQQTRRAEESRLEIEAELSKMKLQGTILGPVSKASINGRIVQEGEIIGGFRVIQIGPRHVTLHKSGCNVRLTML